MKAICDSFYTIANLSRETDLRIKQSTPLIQLKEKQNNSNSENRKKIFPVFAEVELQAKSEILQNSKE